MESVNKVIKNIGTKSLLTGATMAIGSMLLFGEGNNVNVLGFKMPSTAIIGASGVVSSAIGDVAIFYYLIR